MHFLMRSKDLHITHKSFNNMVAIHLHSLASCYIVNIHLDISLFLQMYKFIVQVSLSAWISYLPAPKLSVVCLSHLSRLLPVWKELNTLAGEIEK